LFSSIFSLLPLAEVDGFPLWRQEGAL